MSEFRKDPVSGDWVIIAPERAKRPHDFLPSNERVPTPKEKCPFEDLIATQNWPPFLAVPDEKNWRLVVIPNKFPALTHRHICAAIFKNGAYEMTEGVGHHELVITREHATHFMDLNLEDALEVFRSLQKRYTTLAKDNCVQYVVAFHNYGPSAGASLYHPHYQILSLPITPPDVQHSLDGSLNYYRSNHHCIHCEVLENEVQDNSRIVEMNYHALAITPFASQSPFEVRIYPREHNSFFEKSSRDVLTGMVQALQGVLRKMRKNLHDPDLNFYVHTAPLKDQDLYHHYHWHIEILPKISIPAGFELSTGIQINVIDPDKAAKMLRDGVFDA